jgi:hypothetical protein
MASTTVVLPFARPPQELSADILRALQAPSLATLLSRNNLHKKHAFDGSSRVLPHEAWLAQRLGGTGADAPLATSVMRGLGMAPEAGYWFMVHPVHIQLSRTHLSMADPRQLQLDEADARALFDLAQPFFDTLLWGDANTWFMRADGWNGLQTASTDAATGINLADWMPLGQAALAFKKLQNEIQMLWHEHPVNEARQARGLPPINSFWMWGGAAAPAPQPPAALAISGGSDWMTALVAADLRNPSPSQFLTPAATQRSILLAQLVQCGVATDWSSWLYAMQELEQSWFAPLLAALRAGTLSELTLLLGDRDGWTEIRTSGMALRKFWRAPNLKNLFP